VVAGVGPVSELRRATLYYAARGWPVFPVRQTKTPLTEHGYLDATTEERQVYQWWTRWPRASIGVACGHGCDVLDVDGPEGRASLAELLATHGEDPAILRSWCPSRSGRLDGGTHYWFAPGGPIRWRGFRPHLDWLGLRGYVIAPPSIHASGLVYRWRDGMAPSELPKAPAWLHAAAMRPVREARPPRDPEGDPAGRPGSDFSRRMSWAELLAADGWRLERQQGGVSYWTRPGKARGVSATVGHARGEDGEPLLYVFTASAAALEADTSYSPFAYWTQTRHSGDFGAAAQTLYADGYGEHVEHPGRRCARADCPNPADRLPFSSAGRRRP
jgi:hypothetical protein